MWALRGLATCGQGHGELWGPGQCRAQGSARGGFGDEGTTSSEVWGSRGRALTDAIEGEDAVLRGGAPRAAADADGHHEGFGVVGAGRNLHPADEFLRRGVEVAPLLRRVLHCEPGRGAGGGAGHRDVAPGGSRGSPPPPPSPPMGNGSRGWGYGGRDPHLRFIHSTARVPGAGDARGRHSQSTSLSWLRREQETWGGSGGSVGQ